MKKVVSYLFIFVMLFTALFLGDTIDSSAEGKNVVVVIDPGHGGEGARNLGAQYNGLSEKDLTLQVANALKAELEKYDGVTVYTTRTTDTAISLEDRAAFAKRVGADFVFSIHFNASGTHAFYGSEVWTSTFGNFYVAGANFGNILQSEWSGLGLYQKGIKTRIGSTGKDYYGVIRACVERQIPCVIMEHAYLDHQYDVTQIKSADFIHKLAVADANAIAKYFNLKSSTTGADYTGFKYTSVKKPGKVLRQDETGPEICRIKVLGQDVQSGNILVEMTTKDSQSPVIYFTYSYDGGRTYNTLQMWDRSKETQSFNVKVPSGTVNPTIVCASYNNYEKGTVSNAVSIAGVFNY